MQKHSSKEIYFDLTFLYLQEQIDLMKNELKEVVYNCSKKEEAINNLRGIQKLLHLPATDIISLRRKITNHFSNINEYKIT